MPQKIAMLIYAGLAYIISMLALVYLMGFLIDFGVPKAISDGEIISIYLAIPINFILIGLFGLHHSLTARISFKIWWTRIIPAPIERATYLYMTSFLTFLLVLFWQPIPITIWQVKAPLAIAIFMFVYVLVWVMMLAATFHFGHFGFFGLAQVWQNFQKSQSASTNMTARYLYALVRHPISLGWMVTPLLQPHLTVGHVVFAAATIIYIIAATPFEERDLIASIGKPYEAYQENVPRFVPFLKGSKEPDK